MQPSSPLAGSPTGEGVDRWRAALAQMSTDLQQESQRAQQDHVASILKEVKARDLRYRTMVAGLEQELVVAEDTAADAWEQVNELEAQNAALRAQLASLEAAQTGPGPVVAPPTTAPSHCVELAQTTALVESLRHDLAEERGHTKALSQALTDTEAATRRLHTELEDTQDTVQEQARQIEELRAALRTTTAPARTPTDADTVTKLSEQLMQLYTYVAHLEGYCEDLVAHIRMQPDRCAPTPPPPSQLSQDTQSPGENRNASQPSGVRSGTGIPLSAALCPAGAEESTATQYGIASSKSSFTSAAHDKGALARSASTGAESPEMRGLEVADEPAAADAATGDVSSLETADILALAAACSPRFSEDWQTAVTRHHESRAALEELLDRTVADAEGMSGALYPNEAFEDMRSVLSCYSECLGQLAQTDAVFQRWTEKLGTAPSMR